jgi:hypothetical protein
MKQKMILMILGGCIFPLMVNAMDITLKQKYPNTILTDDYGILNEIDLDSHLDGVKHPPKFSKISKVFIYWQCFPRDSLRVTLQDLGSSLEDDDESDIKYNGENEASLTISVFNKNHTVHKYVVWGRLPITLAESKFNQYLKLMQNEPYVCLAGSYTENQSGINEWAFMKMKTHKGCIAYHRDGCHDGSSK